MSAAPPCLRQLAAAGFVFAAILAAGAARATPMQAAPAPATPAPVCVDVLNDTLYWMPGEIEVPGGARTDFHFQAKSVTRACLGDRVAPGMPVRVVIKSGWGLPIGFCRLKAGQSMRIERRPDKSGTEQTRLVCP